MPDDDNKTEPGIWTICRLLRNHENLTWRQIPFAAQVHYHQTQSPDGICRASLRNFARVLGLPHRNVVHIRDEMAAAGTLAYEVIETEHNNKTTQMQLTNKAYLDGISITGLSGGGVANLTTGGGVVNSTTGGVVRTTTGALSDQQHLNIKRKNKESARTKSHAADNKKSSIESKSFVEYWNSRRELPKILNFTVQRQRAFDTRCKERHFIDNWREIIDKLAGSPFHTGRNDRGWRANIDWILRNDTNFVRILETDNGEKPEAVGLQPGEKNLADEYCKEHNVIR